MTEIEKQLVDDLSRCTLQVGSENKRFVNNMIYNVKYAPEKELSEKQKKYLVDVHHRYRRQIHANQSSRDSAVPHPRSPAEG